MAEPPAMKGCVSATINSRVYVWGGLTASRDTSHLANLYILDSRTEKWLSRPITGQHPPGYWCCAAAQDGNLLYVYGGRDEHRKRTGSFFRLDLDLLSWTELSPHIHDGPKKKNNCGMVIQEDKIFLFGGRADDGRTNELHMFSLSTGLWSSPVITGTTPPPCEDFSFLKVSNSTVVLFGGENMKGSSDELYTLDFNNMHWTEITHKDGEPWPGKRLRHATCCIGVDTSHTQLMITGGVGSGGKYDDMWLLDITSMIWREMPVTQKGSMKQYDHIAATVLITEDVSEVVLFGGTRDRRIISETTIIRLERERHSSITDSSVDEWKVTDIASHLGTRERLQYKKTLNVTDHGNVQTLSNNPEPVKSQRRQSPSEHQTNEPSQNLSQETTPQTKSKEGLPVEKSASPSIKKKKKRQNDISESWQPRPKKARRLSSSSVTAHGNAHTLSDNPEAVMSQSKQSLSEHQAHRPGQHLSQETTPQTKSKVTDHGNTQTLSHNPEPVMSQSKQSSSEHQAHKPGQHLSQETTPQTKYKAKRKKMNKDLLAEWLMEEGVEDDDIKILKSKNVGEILFLKMEVGDKWTTGLSEATIAILPHLQDTLRNL